MESEHSSRYFRWRKSQKQPKRHTKSWPKLTIALHRKSQLVVAFHNSRGPNQDYPLLRTVLRKASHLLHFDRILADAGYDSEQNHVFCRHQLKIRETVIPIKPSLRKRKVRGCTGKYRRQMRWRFPKRYYGQRWQVESYFSRLKRRLGSQLFARSERAQFSESALKVITLNFMILMQLKPGAL